jgi:hypothetical protein
MIFQHILRIEITRIQTNTCANRKCVWCCYVAFEYGVGHLCVWIVCVRAGVWLCLPVSVCVHLSCPLLASSLIMFSIFFLAGASR